MRLRWLSVAFVASFAAGAGSANARPHSFVTECSNQLLADWRNLSSTHPVDHHKHVAIVSVDEDTWPPDSKRYERAIEDLKNAFPSLRVSPWSGILLGCCAIPIFGTVSWEDFGQLEARAFEPLCTIGLRVRSHAVGFRVEYREPYERGEQQDAYFFSYWRSQFSPYPVKQ